jgi:hypothetical protein
VAEYTYQREKETAIYENKRRERKRNTTIGQL